MKKYSILIILMAIILIGAGCTQTAVDNKNETKIVASFYPVYEITKEVTKNTSTQSSVLVPIGAEPHGFEPTPVDIAKISKSDVFVVMGGMFEHIEEDVVNSNNNISIINSTIGIELEHFEEEGHEENITHDDHSHESLEDACIEHGGNWIEKHEECENIEENTCSELGGEFNSCASACRNDPNSEICTKQCVLVCSFEDEHHEETNETHEDDEHGHEEHGDYDPHVWLSIENMIIMTNNIEKELSTLYPKNSEMYKANAKAYIEKLEALEKEYETTLSNCQKDKIIVNHKSFGYIGHEYGFEQIGISGISPESEPTPKAIANVIETANENNLKYIFAEGQLDPKTVETIAKDIEGEVLTLKPIVMNENEDYFSIMKENLKNLAIGLECN